MGPFFGEPPPERLLTMLTKNCVGVSALLAARAPGDLYSTLWKTRLRRPSGKVQPAASGAPSPLGETPKRARSWQNPAACRGYAGLNLASGRELAAFTKVCEPRLFDFAICRFLVDKMYARVSGSIMDVTE